MISLDGKCGGGIFISLFSFKKNENEKKHLTETCLNSIGPHEWSHIYMRPRSFFILNVLKDLFLRCTAHVFPIFFSIRIFW